VSKPFHRVEFESGSPVAAGAAVQKPPRWKRAFDVCVAIPSLVVSAPVILALSLLIKLDGGRPIFAQLRLGQNGQTFRMYKLRTMYRDAEDQLQSILLHDVHARKEFERAGKLSSDPRVTTIGRFLRRTGIDELPQLVNVIKGDMSLVGPRPRSLRWLTSVETKSTEFSVYYTVRPGITGLWQVNRRRDATDRARARMDLEYVRNLSLVNDLAIILRTVAVLFGR
jgi:exopolysaccharide production protein ExoY